MNAVSTQFGLKQTTPEDKAKKINSIFTEVSPFYDKMNTLMSLGIHHWWKEQAVIALSCNSQHIIADIACGTGDISNKILNQHPMAVLYCVDPNQSMLKYCQQRLSQYTSVHFIESCAEQLLLPQKMDRAIISFGLRNFSDPALGLQHIHQGLQIGGKLVIMEFNPPSSTPFAKNYHDYLQTVLPFLGHCFSSPDSYQYLTDSIIAQPTPDERITALQQLGYECITYSPLSFGIVGLFEAYRCY